jgi:putative ABC transport system ATP-binding protein
MFDRGSSPQLAKVLCMAFSQIEEEAILHVNNLCKVFMEGGRKRVVFDGVSASFHRGEFIVLLGSSGSGKSTLLNLISGIEMPTSGKVFIDGVEITGLSERQRTLFRRDNIGFIFQFFNLIPTLTALENIMLPQELAGLDNGRVRETATRLLAQVELKDRMDSFPDKMSGGEQQRVAIARALAHNPRLVLADEPTGNLDENTGAKVLKILLDMTRATGKTLIMATHNPEMVSLADSIFSIHEGRLVREKIPG